MMKKNSTKGYAILSILFILVSVIAFAVPVTKTAAFWIPMYLRSLRLPLRLSFGKQECGTDMPNP